MISIDSYIFRLTILGCFAIVGQSFLFGQSSTFFTNPIFRGQDPFVQYWEGNYYYSESDGDRIFIRKSASLTGIGTHEPKVVWTATRRGWDGHANIWAPELHSIDGKWYLYYAADFATNGRHRLYVLEGGANPLDGYSVAETGAPDGQLVESTGKWAIDPDVFYGPDHALYIVWSCTEDDTGKLTQSLCLARMGNALHIESATVRISTPTEAWERRSGAIQEGPVGWMHDGKIYITYSGSASWTTRDYSAGVLRNAGGDLLNPLAWEKRGPILDGHGGAFGPGSLVFTESPDGSEEWCLYHAYDRVDCRQWGCRSIRAQRLRWDTAGWPMLGYPVEPGALAVKPSGDGESQSGWGGSVTGTSTSGAWAYRSRSSLDSTPGQVAVSRTFRGEAGLLAFSVSVDLQDGTGSGGVRYGLYPLYHDEDNYAEAVVDMGRGIFASGGNIGGVAAEIVEQSLPPGFAIGEQHVLRVDKSGLREFTFYLDGARMQQRTFALDFGQIGLHTGSVGAQFRNVTVTDRSGSWGDAAVGASGKGARTEQTNTATGLMQGGWEVTDASTASSVVGTGWSTLYQGNPNYADYSVEVEARAVSDQPLYGLIACFSDRSNQVSYWIDGNQGKLVALSVVRGVTQTQTVVLPEGFVFGEFHALRVTKRGSLFVFWMDGVPVMRASLDLENGAAGITAAKTPADFRKFAVTPESR